MKIRSIWSKVWIAMIGLTLLIAIAMAFLFYQRSAQLIEENYLTVLSQRARLLADTVDDMLKDVCDITIKASEDAELEAALSAYLSDPDEENLTALAGRLQDFRHMDSVISSLYLVLPEEKQAVTTQDYPICKRGLEEEVVDAWITALQADSGPVVLSDIVNADRMLLVFAQPVADEAGEVLGYVCVNIEEWNLNYDYLEEFGTGETYLLKNKEVLASVESNSMGETLDPALSGWITGEDVQGADSQRIYVYQEGDFSRCGILICVEKSMILGDLNQMRTYVVGVAAVFLLIAFGVSAAIARVVTRPVKKLTMAMQKVSEGEMTTRAEVISQDEIGTMAEEFNRMLDQIEELIDRVIEEEQLKKDAELEALQYQITPHFMYNTLNSIKFYALLHQQKEIADVLNDFVELLQTCIRKKGAFITVAEEVQILENYIRLQGFRNGEAYDVTYRIAKEAEQCLVPRLILQPLVENSILHGMDIKKGQGVLRIEAWVEEERLYLKIADNGRGLSREQIEEILRPGEKKTRGLTAVGIPNIAERLKLYYGQEAALEFESGESGTTAILYLPVSRKKGEEA